MTSNLSKLPLVLLVDDMPANRKLFRFALQEECQIEEACNGAEVLQWVQEKTLPDLILLDLMMPQVDGREVLRQLKANAATRDISIVVITSLMAEDSELECLQLGADDFLTKPVRIATLRARVRNLLSRRQLEVERRRFEALSQASEQKYRQLFQRMAQGVIYYDAHGTIIDANPAACEILGRSKAQLLGKRCASTYFHVIHEDGSKFSDEQNPATTVLATGKPVVNVIMGVFHPDQDRYRWLLINAMPVFEGDESQQGQRSSDSQESDAKRPHVHVTFNDITERKQAEDRLRLSEERLRIATEGVQDGLWEWNPSTNEVYYSREWKAMLGYDESDALPTTFETWEKLTQPDDKLRVMQKIAAYLAGQIPKFSVEFRMRHRDGHWVHILSRATLSHDMDGQTRRLIGFHTDISERREMEFELELHRSHLEEMVAMRTADLDSARVEAERLMQIKSEFLANMSHEIRTPLNGILGLAQIGQRENANQAGQRLFDQLLDSGQILLGIINDILDFSKIEAGKLSIETINIRLDHILEHVKTMCGERAQVKGLHFHIERDATLPKWFLGDSLRIAQILINLVGNAIKFTDQGEVCLSVLRDGERILFRVSDSGIGISPEHLSSLFSPFEQVDGSITRRFGGTGLGLTITQRLVALMRGDIHVESQPGIGSAFEVRLPLVEAGLIEDEANLAALKPVTATGRSLAGLRILAAEDNPVNCMVLEEMLAMEGATLVCVENGRQALDLLMREGEAAWHIVLTDIHMPVMDGHELARCIRMFAPDLPVVGVTAHAMAEEKERCLQSGMVAHVAKPIVMEELFAVILRNARPAKVTEMAAEKPQAIVESSLQPSLHPPAEHPFGLAQDDRAAELFRALQPFLDWEAVMVQYNGRHGFVVKLLQTLLKSHQETPGKLIDAVIAADFNVLSFITHSFAGAASVVQVNDLTEKSREIERQARAGWSGVFSQVASLAQEIDQFLLALSLWLDAGAPTR